MIDQIAKEKEKQRILNEARIEEENKKAALAAKKKEWEAEQAAKKLADAEAKKKKDEEIEQALRDRMAKAGYHNEDIQKVIKGKEVHYCHEHQRPHPCEICISKTTFKESVTKSGFGHKVRKDLICTETLRYFGLLYEHDPVSLYVHFLMIC